MTGSPPHTRSDLVLVQKSGHRLIWPIRPADEIYNGKIVADQKPGQETPFSQEKLRVQDNLTPCRVLCKAEALLRGGAERILQA